MKNLNILTLSLFFISASNAGGNALTGGGTASKHAGVASGRNNVLKEAFINVTYHIKQDEPFLKSCMKRWFVRRESSKKS